jgi:hypothetical protein
VIELDRQPASDAVTSPQRWSSMLDPTTRMLRASRRAGRAGRMTAPRTPSGPASLSETPNRAGRWFLSRFPLPLAPNTASAVSRRCAYANAWSAIKAKGL